MATRRRPRKGNMDDASAALAIQSWANGNNVRINQEQSRVDGLVNQFTGSSGGGASAFKRNSSLRQRKTIRMSKVKISSCRCMHNAYWVKRKSVFTQKLIVDQGHFLRNSVPG